MLSEDDLRELDVAPLEGKRLLSKASVARGCGCVWLALGVYVSVFCRSFFVAAADVPMQVAQLKKAFNDEDAANDVVNHGFLHLCQVSAAACDYEYGAWDFLRLVFPRLVTLWRGLYGNGILSLPLRYVFMLVFVPHSALLHAHLEVMGVQASFSNIFWTALHIASAYLGAYFDLIVLAVVMLKLFGFQPAESESANIIKLTAVSPMASLLM